MIKPMIGVLPLVDIERDSYWMLPGYMKGIEMAGGIPVMLPLTTDYDTIMILVEKMDGILLTGGQDVSPSIYGEEVIPECGQVSAKRDEMEKIIINAMIDADKPMFGICRGIQILNSVCGGTLYQDLLLQHHGDIEHHMTPPYDRIVHKVTLYDNTPLHDILNVNELGVNSYHHQAIKTLAPLLKPMAISEDGLVEAVYMPDKKFIWALQWHPELNYTKDDNSIRIFKEFVSNCHRNV